MAMRLSGLMSGMDTDSVIQELVSIKRKKVDDAKKGQEKLSWKQDIWKDLNSKLKNLQTKYLNNLRFADSYKNKTTKVSHSNIVSVITGENAVNGVQNLEVNQLAKTGYLTGAKIYGANGESVTALTKLSELRNESGNSLFSGTDGAFCITTGGKSTTIQVNADTTISDVLTGLKQAGVNASFDAKQQRFFVSAKESGAAHDFSLTALDDAGASALSALGLQVSLKDDASALAEYQKYAGYYVDGDRAATLANMKSMIDASVQSRADKYLADYKSQVSQKEAAETRIKEIKEKYKDDPLLSADEYTAQLEAKNKEIKELQKSMEGITDPEAKREAEEKLKALKEEASALTKKKADATELAAKEKTVADADAKMAEIKGYVDITVSTDAENNTVYTAAAKDTLIAEVEESYYQRASYAHKVLANYNPDTAVSTGATKIAGQDAEIVLNGAAFTSNSNVFEINGLTFTVMGTTKGESVTITTEEDTEGIYNMVKDFLKEYNSLINEMDKLYNADSAKGYEPLTDEERESMSEKEAEEWEQKIKDSLLRRDSNLSTVSSALKDIMAGGVMVNGKRMYLSDFGINTQGYFEAADNEKNAYHIDGDKDNPLTAAKPDKLMNMIANEPDTVISFFSQLSKDLYNKMSDLSKSVNGYRSYGSFYDDKKMKDEYNDYTVKIADLEKKLNAYEDKWYAKFAAMETAMAKLQGNANAIMGLLGG